MEGNKNLILKCSCFLLLLPLLSIGQIFKGKVVDLNDNPISNTTIQIKNENEENTLLFTTTNSAGEFEIKKNIIQENAVLKISFIGYNTFKQNFKISTGSNDFGKIILTENIEELKEVIVKAESSGISQSGDTTFYKIEKFLNGTEETLKDVIVKIPGLNINDNGKITANGKIIDNLLIDGEDLYKNQHQLATENLPSKIINSAELIQNYLGFENINTGEKTGKTALNIKIKENFKNKFTGFIEGGKGIVNQSKIENSVFNFNKKIKFSSITNFNTIAENPISVNDYFDLTAEKSEENESSVSFSNLNEIPSFLTSKDRVSSKKNIFNSISLTYNFNKKSKLDFYSLINSSNQSLTINREQKFYSEVEDLIIIENKKNKEKNVFGVLNSKFVYKRNDNTIHIIKSNLTFDLSKNLNNVTSQVNDISKEVEQNNQIKNHSLNFSYNLNKKIRNSFFEFKSNYINVSNKVDLKINSNDFFLNPSYLNSDNSLVQYTNKKINDFKTIASFQVKKSKFIFQFSNALSFQNNTLNSGLNYSNNINDIELNYITNNSSANVKYQISPKIDISIKPDFTINKIKYNTNSEFVSYFGYSSSIKAKFNSTNILQFSNSFSNNISKIDNLLDYEIVKDYRNITNNYNVKYTTILPSMQYNLNYFNVDSKNKLTFIFNASHRRNIKSIDNNVISTQDVIYLSNNIISNEKNNSVLLFAEKQFKKFPFAFSFSTSYTNLIKTILNNNNLIEFENHLFSGMFEIKSRYKEFPIYFSSGIRMSKDTYTYNNSKSNLNTYQLYCKLNGKIFKNTYWNMNSDYFDFKNESINSNYVNISPTIRFSKDKSNFEYSIVGNNILNLENISVLENYSNSNYSEFVRKPVLSGYILLQLKYKF
uniref:carboxypeptidase-like regulatory domain-containing protein n=1 Tax=Flavobacterium sp. TaxID=239 RepID=UPI00404B8451